MENKEKNDFSYLENLKVTYNDNPNITVTYDNKNIENKFDNINTLKNNSYEIIDSMNRIEEQNNIIIEKLSYIVSILKNILDK